MALGAAAATLLWPCPGWAQETVTADVVVIVDTSISMKEEGMDPQWTSLLVTKLLADIVPGDLAVVRSLDIAGDKDVLPGVDTGRFEPCYEDPSRQCGVVEPATDWEADARAKKLGAKVRPARGSPQFKNELEQHLEQRIHNSMFTLGFAATQGIFDDHKARAGGSRPRTVIWLSDGRADAPPSVERRIRELLKDGVAVKAIVFGRGETSLARGAGLDALQVSTPAEMMNAFADAFRQIVQAPYRVDHRLSAAPGFEMKPYVDEAWIVVYGDDTLGEVTLDGPGGEVRADYGADRLEGAGAYKVAYLRRPAAGKWTVRAEAGGIGAAYAVVQRSVLTPVLLEPAEAVSGAEVALVGAVRAGLEGEVITDPEVLAGLALRAELQGQDLILEDSGSGRDVAAGDGRYTSPARFRGSGEVIVTLHLIGDVVDRKVEAVVVVSGEFHYTGPPVEVDLGELGISDESCRELDFTADQRGEVAFELARLRSLPAGHRLEVRMSAGTLQPGGEARSAAPGERFEVCLATSENAPSSTGGGEPWLELRVAGSRLAEHVVPVRLFWRVNGLSFWQRWGWLILSILGILLLLVVGGGYVLPNRFSGTFAVVFVPEREDLDEQSPQPVRQWSGVGIGFYRDARAFLHPDFRLSGKSPGALASLHAEKSGVRVRPGRSQALHRETLDGDWENVAAQGKKTRAGDVYRVGDNGPYFRISTHRGR